MSGTSLYTECYGMHVQQYEKLINLIRNASRELTVNKYYCVFKKNSMKKTISKFIKLILFESDMIHSVYYMITVMWKTDMINVG